MLTQNLSLKQIEAVNAIDDDVEIIACAGAGKTGVVTRRIINILKCKDDVIPNNIVAFTFTKKAAEELKSRVYSMGKDVLGDTKGFAEMYIGTIHGFCLKMLQEYLPEFQTFTVLDDIHTKLFVERYYEEIGMKDMNLLERDFKADQPNQKWVTDVTEFALFGIKLYLSPIIDLYNGEVISYNLSRHPNLNQVTDMLEKAFSKIPDNTNLILHSDQGWQYQHKHYQKMLKEKGVKQSMSRKGNCLDNACAENFFSLLKTELLYLQEFHSVEHFIEELHEYIEWYNNKRIKLKLNGLSPIDFRQEAA